MVGNGMFVIFDGWANDEHTEFNTSLNFYFSDKSYGKEEVCLTERFRLATPEEKQLIISSHENTEEKYAKIKIPHKFIAGEPVLVMDEGVGTTSCEWNYCIYSHYSIEHGKHVASGLSWDYCIPYNEETKNLLGSTNDYEE